MSRHGSSSSSEEERERRININRERANYLPRAELEEIHAMMAQSLAIHEKSAQQDAWRRAKAGKKREIQMMMTQPWRMTCRTAKNVFGASFAMHRGRELDHRSGAKGSTSKGSTSPSGFINAAAFASSSKNFPTSSGSSIAAAVPTTTNMTLLSGSSSACADAAASMSSMTSQSGLQSAASGAGSYFSANAITIAAAAESGSIQSNPLNDFQTEYPDKMRAEHWRFQSTGKEPA
eukprot:s247_g18.t1